jgi:hypothetical protein
MTTVEIEIKREVTITREESVTVEVDIPQEVLDDPDPDVLFDWVEERMKSPTGSEVSNAATAAGWENLNEDEDIEYTEVTHLT